MNVKSNGVKVFFGAVWENYSGQGWTGEHRSKKVEIKATFELKKIQMDNSWICIVPVQNITTGTHFSS